MIQRAIVVWLCITLSACETGGGETSLAGLTQGTTYHIKLVPAGAHAPPAEVQQDIEAIFRTVDEHLSNYRDDSEISLLNGQRTTEWLPASPEITHLLLIAREVHRASAGCYDLTVKPLFDLWGFAKQGYHIPEQSEIDRTLPNIGMAKLEIDAEHGRIRKQVPDLAIDLSSIAQGYTVEAIAKVLEGRGIHNYLVEIGGEMKVKGRKANGKPWRVAIEKPTPVTREVQQILDIDQARGVAIMTSGTYRNYFDQAGQVYSHILDPRTGRPVTHRLLSVTVLHDDPTWADAWSTALLCVGEVDGPRIAAEHGLKALFIHHRDGALQEIYSPTFQADRQSVPNAPGTASGEHVAPPAP